MNTNRVIILLLTLFISMSFYGQSKLTREQVLNAVRTHQESVDSICASDYNYVNCDSTTTKILLEVLNDSLVYNQTYRVIFTQEKIELIVFNAESNLYRSTFEYEKSSFETLKSKINQYKLQTVDSYNEINQTVENNVLKLYRGNKVYTSIESYNGRTNIKGEFHSLIKEIKEFIPNITSEISICTAFETIADHISSDSIAVNLKLSENTLKFRSKGGDFKKINVTCNIKDWEILSYPEWIIISKNSNNEIVIESTENCTKKLRTGTVKVGCLGEIKEISISQN